MAVPGLQWRLIAHRRVTDAPLDQLRGLARLLLLDAERAQSLHQLLAHNVPMPSLAQAFGHLRRFAGYGPGMHDSVRTLPTAADDAARTHDWYHTMTASHDFDDDDNDNRVGCWLIVPSHQRANGGDDSEDEPYESEEPPPVNPRRREAEWRLILDAGRDNLRIPRTLEWGTTPRTREYLNALDGETAAEYFAPVYRPQRRARRTYPRA